MNTNRRASRPKSNVRRQILATIVSIHGTMCAVKGCGTDTVIGGSPKSPDTFNLGHVTSDANGGAWNIGNLLPICRRCNEEMGDHDWPADMMVRTPVSAPLLPDPGATVHSPGPLSTYWK